MTPLDQLDAGAIPAIAELCRRGLTDPPSADELAGALFAPDQPAMVRGDPAVGVVATVRDAAGAGFVRLLVVDPAARANGHGRALLEAAETDIARSGARSVTVGADPPYYLFPGVLSTETAMLCLLERCRYRRADTNFNMVVDLRTVPADPGGTTTAGPADRDEVAAWMEKNWANWTPEVLRALDRGTLLISRDDEGIAGFCAYNVNRHGLLGPVGVRLGLIGRGAGAPLLIGALHRMRADGADHIEVAWVGPIVPYARVGGVISRVFFVYRKQLP